MPLRWVLAQRGITFMKHILNKHDNELIKKIFLAQKDSPNQGDFVQLVTKDLIDLNMTFEEVSSENLTKVQLKKKLKINAIAAALKQLKEELLTHTKVRNISYQKLEMQPYLKSQVLTLDEIHQLTSFRSQCVRGVRTHFRKMYSSLVCPMKCSLVTIHEDTADHLLKCSKLTNLRVNTININQIYANIVEQEEIAQTLSRLMRQRSTILEKQEQTDLSN